MRRSDAGIRHQYASPGCTGLVREHGNDPSPRGVRRSRGVGPATADPQPSLDAARGARCRGSRNARVTVVGEHLRSRAVGKVRGQPRGRRPEADQPGDGTVGLTQQLADLEDGTDVRLVAAELLW